ncbi:HTTM domain-containing protein [Chryseobacterium sp. A301]
MFLHFLSIQKDFDFLYGANAIVPADIQTVYLHSLYLYDDIIGWLTLIAPDVQGAVFLFKALYFAACLFIVLGFGSRFWAIALLILQIGLVKSAYYFSYGADYFTSLSLLYIVLHPSDRTFSVSAMLFKRKPTQDYPFFALQRLHLNFIYFISGVEKLSGVNWRNGESVWKALHLPNFSNDFNLNIDQLGAFPILFIVAGWLTILIEMLYPVFMNFKVSRGVGLIAIIALHLGIALFLNLYFFSAIMIVWNLTIYYIETNDTKLPIES